MSGNDRDEILSQGESIRDISDETAGEHEKQEKRADRVDALVGEISALAERFDIDMQLDEGSGDGRPKRLVLPADLEAAAGCLSSETLAQIDKDMLSSVRAVPSMDSLDRFMILSVGCLAALADFLLVGLPPKTPWTPGDEGGVVPVGWLSKKMKSWTVDDNNWLANLCHVPFDKSTLPGTDFGFSPVNHRALSFGHDPSPIGFVFGLMDIATSRMSGVGYGGQPFSISNVTGVPMSWTKISLAPLVWIGHLISDVATPMGLPVPGATLFQLIRISVPGAPDNATVADIARIAYQRGFDFRHYLAGGVVPGLVEGLIRLYYWLRNMADGVNESTRDPVRADIAPRYVAKERGDARLNALLFYTHAVAAGANAGRIALQGATGDFFSAVRSINLMQWQLFSYRSVKFALAFQRDTSVEQALKNRDRLDSDWERLENEAGSAQCFYTNKQRGFEKVLL